MESYKINDMVFYDEFEGEENIRAEVTHNNKQYSITFDLGDFNVLHAWRYEEDKALPANLSNDMIASIREDIKRQINK